MKTIFFLGLLFLIIIGAGIVVYGIVNAAPLPSSVNVNLSEYKVIMSSERIAANTAVQFTIVNNGTVEHEVVLEKKGSVDEALEIGNESAEVEHIQPGETRTQVWTIADPGDYQLACHIEGHYQGGMVQAFTVVPPGGGSFDGLMVWLIIGLLVIVLFGGGFVFMRNRKAKVAI